MLVMHQRSVFIVVGAIEIYVFDDDEGGGGGDPFTAFTLLALFSQGIGL